MRQRDGAPDIDTGHVVRPSRAAGAERRQVTMLACSSEVFDAAAFFALDAEDQARVRATFDHLCEESSKASAEPSRSVLPGSRRLLRLSGRP